MIVVGQYVRVVPQVVHYIALVDFQVRDLGGIIGVRVAADRPDVETAPEVIGIPDVCAVAGHRSAEVEGAVVFVLDVERHGLRVVIHRHGEGVQIASRRAGGGVIIPLFVIVRGIADVDGIPPVPAGLTISLDRECILTVHLDPESDVVVPERQVEDHRVRIGQIPGLVLPVDPQRDEIIPLQHHPRIIPYRFNVFKIVL